MHWNNTAMFSATAQRNIVDARFLQDIKLIARALWMAVKRCKLKQFAAQRVYCSVLSLPSIEII